MKLNHLFLVTTLAAPSSVTAWETGQELSKVVYSSIDASGNGALDFGEVTKMAESIAVSADSDDNEQISLAELMAWDLDLPIWPKRKVAAMHSKL